MRRRRLGREKVERKPAKRRKNAAHGASRGKCKKIGASPEGAKEATLQLRDSAIREIGAVIVEVDGAQAATFGHTGK